MARLWVACLTLGVLLSVVSVVTPVGGADDGSRPEEGEIYRLYRSILGREPEAGGFEYWVLRRQTGTSLARVASHFLDSDEYRERFVPTGAESDDDEAFIARVYRLVLERSPDTGGFRYWIGRLEYDLTRPQVVLHFSESDEFRQRTGTSLPELPPFQVSVRGVTAEELGASWAPGCPVGPAALRQLTVTHVGLDGLAVDGALVVHADVTDQVVTAFARLYDARYPIEQMRPVTAFGADDELSMAANNTSAFNCRAVTGGTGWSRHAYGRAIDINPLVNPFVQGGLGNPDAVVLPEGGEDHLERSRYHPMMIRDGDVVVSTFEAMGWRWGGRWTDPYDPQHFDRR